MASHVHWFRQETHMFGVDWNDPQTLWLNLTNLALGLAALACVAAVGYNVVRELLARRQKLASSDRMLAGQRHAMHVGDLGWTMADGGEPTPPPVFTRPPEPRKK